MSDPDELYTLRAQYWLGHYQLALEEAKSVARRPMSPNLKAEREELLARIHIALRQYDKASATDTPGLEALALKAQFESAGSDSIKAATVDQLKSLVASNPVPAVQLAAAQVLLAADQTKEALQCVHTAATMEHIATILQIYLKIDRLDLAKKQLQLLKQQDEDAVLTQLGSVYCNLATGSTGAADAVHSLNSMTEQYGASPLLLNLMACALMQQGDFVAAEDKLQECLRDHETPVVDTLVNLISCCVQQGKAADQYIGQMKEQYPSHSFCAGLDRVTAAFDREAVKYKV